MKSVIIFGAREFAQMALFYLKTDSHYNVAAFTVSEAYMGEATSFEDLPLVRFEEVEKIYPPEQYDFFVPMTPTRMNRNREKIYLAAKQKGYSFISYVHSSSVVAKNAPIGENCFILEKNVVMAFASIGNNVTLLCGNLIGHHAKICDHVFLTNAVLGGHVIVKPHCFLGLNSSVNTSVTLADGTYVPMDTAVLADTKPWSVYRGTSFMKQGKARPE